MQLSLAEYWFKMIVGGVPMIFDIANASKLLGGGRMVFPLAVLVAGMSLVGCANSTVAATMAITIIIGVAQAGLS